MKIENTKLFRFILPYLSEYGNYPYIDTLGIS